jgi:hypothetical protein
LAEFADLNAAHFVGLIVGSKTPTRCPFIQKQLFGSHVGNNVIANRGLGFKRPIR